MRKFAIALLALAVCASAALADVKPALEKDELMVVINAALTEVEPNGTAATANPIASGDTYAASLSPAADQDWFVFTSPGGPATFETSAGPAVAAGDTKLYIYASDGTTQLAFDDDSGAGFYSLKTYSFTAGTFYIKIIHYSATGTGNYVLACTAPTPPAANDLCTGAIDIQAQSLSSWAVNLTGSGGYYNDYSLPTTGSCTGYSTPGPDALYKINLAAGEQIIIDENGTCDLAVWIATDCANLLTTCVAGADATVTGSEIVTYTAAAAGTYFVVIDSYSAAGCPVTVTVNAPVATENESFGALKAMFR